MKSYTWESPMTQIDTGNEKVKKICDLIKTQTLDPAKEEAKKIVLHAKKDAEKIIADAEEKARLILEQAQNECESKRKLLESSLRLAAKQAVSSLKQQITEELFSKPFAHSLKMETSKPSFIAKAIEISLQSIFKNIPDDELLFELPKTVSPEQILQELSSEARERVKKSQIEMGAFQGGVVIHYNKENIAIDLTDNAANQLLSRYIAQPMQQYLFHT